MHVVFFLSDHRVVYSVAIAVFIVLLVRHPTLCMLMVPGIKDFMLASAISVVVYAALAVVVPPPHPRADGPFSHPVPKDTQTSLPNSPS